MTSKPSVFLNSFHSFNSTFAAAKACKSQVALAHLSKAASRSTNYVALFKQLIKEGPACKALRNLQPYVWRILTSKGFEAGRPYAFKNDTGVFAVEGKIFLNLLLAFFRINGLGCTLSNVGNTVKLCRLAAEPECIQFSSIKNKIMRNNCVAAA